MRDQEPGPAADPEPAGQIAETPEEIPDLQGAYPRLGDEQIVALAELGQRRPMRPEEILFSEGDRDCDFSWCSPGTSPSSTGTGRPRSA